MSTEAPKEISSRGTWIPLESNPEIFNTWAEQLGLGDAFRFEDVYGLDPELLDMVTKPVRSVLCIFPITTELEQARKAQDTEMKEKGQAELDPTLFFIEQHISNACGTIGLLHALANTPVSIDPMGPLFQFIDGCRDSTPSERADLLASTTLFSAAHSAAATSSQSSSHVPKELNTSLHFITFVQAPNPQNPEERRLIELDGRRPAPLDYGPSTDLLQDVAKVVKEKYISLTTSMQFGLVALCGGVPDSDMKTAI